MLNKSNQLHASIKILSTLGRAKHDKFNDELLILEWTNTNSFYLTASFMFPIPIFRKNFQ